MAGKVITTPALYLLRHGETPYNAGTADGSEEKVRGWQNVPLNKDGLQEAHEIADDISKMFPSAKSGAFPARPVQAYSSDLKRALQTSKIVTARLGLPLIPTMSLRTWKLGEFEGKPVEKWIKAFDHYVFDRPNERTPGGGESLRDFTRRFIPFLDYLIDQVETTGRSQIAFTHLTNQKAAQAWIKGDRMTLDLPTFAKRLEASDTGEIHRIYQKARNGPWIYQVVNNQSGEGENHAS